MWVKTLSLVFLFILRLRFPQSKSIATNLRTRYGNPVLKTVRKFEKLDFKIRKIELDLSFLQTCDEKKVIPKFLQFRTANKTLKSSDSYKQCQELLLNEEIKKKQDELAKARIEFKTMKTNLYEKISYFDFLYIVSLFLDKNKSAIEKIEIKQNIKLLNLLNFDEGPHDPKKIIHNFSSHVLTKEQENLLMKGLNYGLPLKKLRYENYMINFELLFRDVEKLNISSEERVFAKNHLKNTALSSYRSYNQKNHKLVNLTQEEHDAFIQLLDIDNLVIQKTDKGNAIVIVDKNVYNDKIESILSDNTKFQKVNFSKINKELDYLMDEEAEIKVFLKDLHTKGVISDAEFERLTPHGSQPGILYGLCKVHKECVDKSPPFRPILSAIRTPSYELAKFLVPMLSDLTKNEYVTKDSFSFAKEVKNQDASLFMTSFDIDSLFTNLPLDETIELCVKKLFKGKKKVKGFDRNQFKTLLQFATKKSFFLFNGKYYIQTDGVSMGSPLGPTLANVFLCHWELDWLKKCPKQFKPLYYKRFMDDTFLLFKCQNDVKKFHKYIGSRHKNMKFTFEIESGNCLAFLDVLITRDGKNISTSLYRKPTFSGIYSNFSSFMPINYKKGLVFTLLYRGFSLCTNWSKFQSEVLILKSILGKNGYPRHFVDKCIKVFFNKMSVPKQTVSTVSKKELRICLPFMGIDSLKIRKELFKFAKDYLPGSCKLQIIFSTQNRLGDYFKFKDKIPLQCRSFILYKYLCNKCNLVYYGKTFRHYKVRVYEHLGKSLKTDKPFKFNSKNSNNTAVLNHIHNCKCKASMDDFKIIGSAKNDYHLRIKESIIIKKDNPILNKSVKSTPLSLL